VIRKVLILSFSLFLTASVSPVSNSEEYFPADTPFWVDCSLGFRATDCVESVEFSDPASERKDANGQHRLFEHRLEEDGSLGKPEICLQEN